ncbi:MAG: RNA-binding cell elongation regulator Jag/EloR [Chloroflexota bacterium]
MAEEAEFSGRTIDEAIAEAEAALGASQEDLVIEVLASGSRGVFGIGAEQARIRATVQGAESDRERPERPWTEPQEPRSAAQTEQLAEDAQTVLERLLHAMGFDAAIEVQDGSEPLVLSMTGENLGLLIGRHGDNLSALQFMVNLILSKGRRQWPGVVLDVENYRSRREESLRALADRIAFRVDRNGSAFTMEAMPASDRRIVHLALRERPEVETYSIGEGANRRVVVAPRGEDESSEG